MCFGLLIFYKSSAFNGTLDPFPSIWLLFEGHRTQTIWPEGRCFQFWNSSLGAFNWRSEYFSCQTVGFLLCDLFSFCLKWWSVLYHSYWYTISLNQLPYSCLTPLQAAVGVVQKVFILFLLQIISSEAISCLGIMILCA